MILSRPEYYSHIIQRHVLPLLRKRRASSELLDLVSLMSVTFCMVGDDGTLYQTDFDQDHDVARQIIVALAEDAEINLKQDIRQTPLVSRIVWRSEIIKRRKIVKELKSIGRLYEQQRNNEESSNHYV